MGSQDIRKKKKIRSLAFAQKLQPLTRSDKVSLRAREPLPGDVEGYKVRPPILTDGHSVVFLDTDVTDGLGTGAWSLIAPLALTETRCLEME